MSTLVDDTLLAGLNPAQREAVLHSEGPLLVLAGAGSGKTRVLTTRIVRLIDHHHVDPSQLLTVTFTNKAAGEMRERIARMLGTQPIGMWAGTFHAIGARFLRSHAHFAGRETAFTIYDEDDAIGVIKRILERRKISPKQFTPRAFKSEISSAKNALTHPDDYAKGAAPDPFHRAVADIYPEYDEALRVANAVDFDDLLVLPVRIFQRQPEVLAKFQRKFRYILVDEYQDTNRAQYEFIRMLGSAHGNVCVVGDDDQSIYGWRGADIRNILDFNQDFPGAMVVRLEENYRSTPPILELANVVIAANTGRMGKTLRPTLTGGDRVTIVRSFDERDEADFIVDELRSKRGPLGLELRDIAVLYRTNAQSRAIEEAMRKHAIPYRLIGAVRFYDRREIRDLMSYLKLIANPSDDEAFRRAIAVPRRGVGETTIDVLGELAATQGIPMLAAATRPDVVASLRPAARTALAEFAALMERFRASAQESAVDELLQELITAIKYGDYLRSEGEELAQDRLDNVRELVAGAEETVADELGEVGLRPLDHFLQRATLVAEVDKLDPNADAITCMTLHNAKGLEFPMVFITGLEDGLFPLAKAFDNPEMLEEERRLFYVGITRAERKLYITHAEQRRRNGEFMMSKASSFLTAIPDAMVEKRNTVKVRSSGRSFLDDFSGEKGARTGWGARMGGYGRDGTGGGSDDYFPTSAASRRPGTPVFRETAPEDESQDAAVIAVGSRVRHRKFGSGTIAEIAGSGRDAKAKIDFDDEEIGRKTLVVAQANLEREID